MAKFSEIKMIQGYDAEVGSKRNRSFGPNFINIKRFVFFGSCLAILLLFLPFAKAGVLAFIFALAILEAREKVKSMSKSKQHLLLLMSGFLSVVLVSLFVSLGQCLYQVRDIFTDATSFAEIKSRVSALLLPSVDFLKETVSTLLLPIDGSKYVEIKISESVNHFIDFSFSWFLGWLLEIPNHFLQIAFFAFMLFFLAKNMESQKTYNFLLNLEVNDKTLKFFIEAANRSGFNAVVTTILTALAQAVLLTLGATLIGIKIWPLVFVAAFISSMLPVVGILPVAIFCTLYAATMISHGSAMIMAMFAVAASMVDNILRPLLVSGEDSPINPILSFFALIGSLFLFGFSGLFIGPFILIFTTMVFKKYIQSLS